RWPRPSRPPGGNVARSRSWSRRRLLLAPLTLGFSRGLAAVLLLPRLGDAERIVERLVGEVEVGQIIERGLAHRPGDRLDGDGLDRHPVVLSDLMPPRAREQLVGELADQLAERLGLLDRLLGAQGRAQSTGLGPIEEHVAAI